MIRALIAEVRQVEIIGGEGWLEHNSVAIAAIVAAGLAALVSVVNRRAQLKHDREMRSQDHVRDAIDDAIVCADETRNALKYFVAVLTSAEDHREEQEAPLSEEVINYLTEQREKTFVQVQAMKGARSRLEIRLEEADAVVETYQKLLQAFTSAFKESFKGIPENRESVTREGDAARGQQLENAFYAFQAACRHWLREGSSGNSSRPNSVAASS